MSTASYDPQKNILQPQKEESGSIESAVAGHYDFTVGDILSEAWRRIDGYKMPYAIIVSVYMLAYLGLVILVFVVLGADSSRSEGAIQLLSLLLIPMGAAMTMTGLHMACGRPITVSMLWAYYDKLFPLIGLQIIMTVAIAFGLILLIIPGIYLSIALMFAIPLAVEKDLPLFDAFEVSRKAVTHRWFTVFGVLLVMGVLIFLSALPLGIGLFWTTPMMAAVVGVMYRRMFGINETPTIGS